jgi:uncharacterized membrane protein (DUF485 family)
VYPLNKWHKGNPLVWVGVYVICLTIVALFGAILAPFGIGTSTIINILEIGIRIGFGAIVVTSLALIYLHLENKRAKKNQDKYYHEITRDLRVILKTIGSFTTSDKLPLIFKKLKNIVNLKENAKK